MMSLEVSGGGEFGLRIETICLLEEAGDWFLRMCRRFSRLRHSVETLRKCKEVF